MNNAMIAHLWANEQQGSAKGSNFFFEGDSIYSYGRHFEAGRIVWNKRGERAYLVNTSRYSVTTGKHMSKVWGSLPTDALVFGMEKFIEGGMLFVTNKLEVIKNTAEKYKRARTEISYQNIWEPFKNLINYIKFFDMGTPKRILKRSVNEWLVPDHELGRRPDKVKREYVHELKRIFKIMLDHQSLADFGTVNVIVDEICGEGTWINYTERCQRYRLAQEKREAKAIERARIENEAKKKTLEERVRMWKAGEIKELNAPWGGYFEINEPNVWLRIKNGKVETSKGVKLSKAETERLWRRIKSFHDGAQFQHDLARDSSGHSWAFNSYKNDLLIAGCHRIAYSEMEDMAMKLGFI